jgi:hypothetical protein
VTIDALDGDGCVVRRGKPAAAASDGDRAGDVEVFAPATAAGVGGQEDSRHRDERRAEALQGPGADQEPGGSRQAREQ